MVWSYSRIKTFKDCPYRFYLKYIRRLRGKEMFFSSYGTFMHKLIESYYTEHKTNTQLVHTYVSEFGNSVVGHAPNKTVFVNYFNQGLNYLKNIKPFPCEAIALEKGVDFNIDGYRFVGYIDFLGKKDNDVYVIDHKSRMLKPRSNRKIPTKTDEELDSYLTQLYIYSEAVKNELGVFPKKLCFNCFRSGVFIEEPFSPNGYSTARKWLSDSISEIRKESDFEPSAEYFKCTHLCELHDECEYYQLSK